MTYKACNYLHFFGNAQNVNYGHFCSKIENKYNSSSKCIGLSVSLTFQVTSTF